MNNAIIGLSGTIGSGKDTLAEYLADNYGYLHISTGDMVREEAMRREGSIERPILKKVATALREEGGGGVLAKLALEKYHGNKDAKINGVIVTGIRSLGEAEAIKAATGILMFVDVPVEERYRRIVARLRDSEARISFEEFKARDDLERYAGSRDADHNLNGIEAMADVLLENTITLDEFLEKACQKLQLKHR